MAGIVVGVRTVITKARATMAIVTVEDLQGSLEIVVFPRTWEETARLWAEGSVLVVAGRVDHRGEDVSLLADLVVEWDAAMATGPEAFARQVAATDRGRGGRRSGPSDGPSRYGSSGGNGSGLGDRPADRRGPAAPMVGIPVGDGGPGRDGHPFGDEPPSREPVAVGPGRPVAAPAGSPAVRAAPASSAAPAATAPRVPYVSPLRPEARRPAPEPGIAAGMTPVMAPGIEPAEPMPMYSEPPGLSAGVERDDEPPLPDEERRRMSAATTAATTPLDAGPGGILHVRFNQDAATDRLVGAMEEVRSLLRARPGATRVVLHVPQGGGRDALPMELRVGVAYDADLLGEVGRRLGAGLVDLRLA
jgi:hypothetical protein